MREYVLKVGKYAVMIYEKQKGGLFPCWRSRF